MTLPQDPATQTTPTGGCYRFSRNADNTYNIHDVEIMGEIPKHARFNEKHIGPKWQAKAVERARLRAAEGFMAPLHVYHHDGEGRAERAGFVMPRRIGEAVVGGERISAIFADFLSIPESQFNRIKAGELPYRSIEANKWEGPPEILSLALLPDESPFFKFSLLTVGEEIAADSVTHFSNGAASMLWAGYRLDSGESLILCRNRFGGAKFMADEKKDDEKDEKPKMVDDELEAAIVAVLKKLGVLRDEEEDKEEMADDEEDKDKNLSDKTTNTDQAPVEQPAGKPAGKPSASLSAEVIRMSAKVAALEKGQRDREAEEKARRMLAEVRAEHLQHYDLDEKAEALMLKLARSSDREGLVTFATVYAETAEPRKPNTMADYEGRAVRGRSSDPKEVAAYGLKSPEKLAEARQFASEHRIIMKQMPGYPVTLERFIETQFERKAAMATATGAEEE